MRQSLLSISALVLALVLALAVVACDEQGRTEPGTPAPFGETPGEFMPQPGEFDASPPGDPLVP